MLPGDLSLCCVAHHHVSPDNLSQIQVKSELRRERRAEPAACSKTLPEQPLRGVVGTACQTADVAWPAARCVALWAFCSAWPSGRFADGKCP